MAVDNSTLHDKRKIETFDDLAEPVKKKRKKSEFKNVKPPTAEEINRLRETENVFHSNLFRLQIEEILKEIKISEKTNTRMITWTEKLKDFLLNIDFSFSAKLSENHPVNVPNVLLPMKSKLRAVETSFKFVKPKSVDVFGSFASNCVMKNSGSIDVVVEMPKEIFQKEDYLNEKYLRKRNIYLSCLASQLLESIDDALVDPDIQYVLINNVDKPLLRVKPAEPKLQKYSVFIHLILEDGTFKGTRFLPCVNNVRYGWFFDTTGDGKLNTATPYYNSIICQDMVVMKNEELRKVMFNENPNLKDAYLLLKVWLHQRKLDEGLSSFSGFLLAMFMVYLFKKRKLNKLMSSYQIIRTVWLALDQSDWHIDGISLADVVNDSKADNFDVFKSNYEVVFVDVTGHVNLASVLSLASYLYLKNQSKCAVQCLDDSKMNHFPALFMTPVVITREFDHILYFKKLSCVRKTVKQNVDVQMQLDLRNDTYSQFLKIISKLLRRSLGKRVSQIYHSVEPSSLSWLVNEKIPRYGNVMVALKIDSERAYNIIDKGPTANLPEAAEFREFWGAKSELRRFRDGDVCETVCWAKSSDTLQKKRLIIREIVRYILDDKLQIRPEQYLYIADQFESVVYDTYNEIFASRGTGEEATLDILASFMELSKTLRTLKDLPLEITSIQGSSPVFRYSELFPPLSNTYSSMKKSLTSNETATVFKSEISAKHMPLYIAPVQVVIQFSISNKWPTDLGAIRRLQAAFYLKLSSILKSTCKYVSQPYRDHVDILKDGYVFRIRISNNSEISAVKRRITEDGLVQYCDIPESLHLERTLVQLPALTSAIHGLHQQYPSFGPACAMAKRWLRSQLVDEFYFSDVCVDLSMSHLFLNPQPYTPCYQPQTMFLRFLKLISSTDWFADQIIINFNDELSREKILEIDSNVNQNRANLPPLILVTPFDKSGIMWTADQPSVMILKRLTLLADAALRLIDSSLLIHESRTSLQQIFRPPLKGYDLLIWTIPTVNSMRWFAVDADINTLAPIKDSPDFDKLPILSFHPVQSYIQELRKHYSDQCLFFYDFYGGNFIGVVLNPEAKLTRDLKVTNMKCSMESQNKLSLNIEALIEDFRILGDGLVSCIENCTENT